MEKRGCDVFIDLGASVGIYTLQVAKRGLAKEIHAFEPDPRNFAQLMGNMYLNGLTDVIKAHPEAVSSASGPIRFEMASAAKTTMTQVAAAPSPENTNKMGHLTPGTGIAREAMASALDDVMPCKGKKVFIKIDIQGHELDAFKGAAKLLADNDCFIQVAIWKENEATVLPYLAGLGYKVIHSIPNDFYLTK
jgi:FkbM family methyltransferase